MYTPLKSLPFGHVQDLEVPKRKGIFFEFFETQGIPELPLCEKIQYLEVYRHDVRRIRSWHGHMLNRRGIFYLDKIGMISSSLLAFHFMYIGNYIGMTFFGMTTLQLCAL
jgi:hypothetical protein